MRRRRREPHHVEQRATAHPDDERMTVDMPLVDGRVHGVNMIERCLGSFTTGHDER